MRVQDAIAKLLKKEGVSFFAAYPVNPLLESAAAEDIRIIVCRQERVGVGISDAYSRITNGHGIGVFGMQSGPGTENAFSGVATAFADSTPILLFPMGYARALTGRPRHFNSTKAFEPITKWAEELIAPSEVVWAIRRAFTQMRNGRPGPVLIELPNDVVEEEISDAEVEAYQPTRRYISHGDPRDIEKAAEMLVKAKHPIIYAGQGVLYAEASAELTDVAEVVDAPVLTSLLGKSAIDEYHPLSMGVGAGARPMLIDHFMAQADVVLAVGTSLTEHRISALPVPRDKTIIHLTIDETDLNKNHEASHAILGDAKPVLAQLAEAVRSLRASGSKTGRPPVAAEVASQREAWLNSWMPKLTSDEVPINPYRVIGELSKTLDPKETIITHDSGSPRNQMVPFYRSSGPRTYIGWGKAHALGSGLGFAMGAKLADPSKTVINWMGDAAFGMVGMDFETAARCKIPIITIVSNNFAMAIEAPRMAYSREKYGSANITGNYADLARALGGHAERVEDPAQIAPAIERARAITEEQQIPALIEVMTCEETVVSNPRGSSS